MTILINYTFERSDDVDRIRESLLELGMNVRLKLLPNKSYSLNKGRLYYNPGSGERSLEVVSLVKSLIDNIEPVKVTMHPISWILQNPYDLSLWIVS